MKQNPDVDFTGNEPETPASKCSIHVGTTGSEKVDAMISTLSQTVSKSENECALAEMMVTAVQLASGEISQGDLKMLNRALKELRAADVIFTKYKDHKKVAVFGSARTPREDPEYQTAMSFAARMKEHGYMTITGAGPGIMAAGNEGAGRDESFGLNITLPFEASANQFILGDEKLIDFNYFFTRKLSFVKEADAAVACPGGVGTMDEIFEAMTLIQTGKATIYPLILLNAPGSTYWSEWTKFLKSSLLENQYISETDFHLWKVTDSVDVAVQEILKFYSNFQSYRYIRNTIVFRIKHAPNSQELADLNERFSDIVESGEMTLSDPLPEERNELDHTRLIFHHKRRDYGRLRLFIDALNELNSIS